jgi:hypothetical protein
MKRKTNARRAKVNSGRILSPAENICHSRKLCQPLPLPAELLHQVCSLTTSEVTSFRLGSKSFAAVGEEHLIEELCFFHHPRSIAKVTEIANSGRWAGRVKTLVFEDVRFKDWLYVML